jgi:hypothetical protein
MRVAGLSCVLTLVVFLVGSHRVGAQPLCDRTAAIETTVINSDYVFIAKLVSIQPKKTGDERYGQDAIIAIEETLKAELFREEPYDKLNVYLPYQPAVLQGLLQRSNRVLVALASHNHDENVAIELAPPDAPGHDCRRQASARSGRRAAGCASGRASIAGQRQARPHV